MPAEHTSNPTHGFWILTTKEANMQNSQRWQKKSVSIKKQVYAKTLKSVAKEPLTQQIVYRHKDSKEHYSNRTRPWN